MPNNIRKYISLVENVLGVAERQQIITEMPQLIGPHNFGLDDEENNRLLAQDYLNNQYQIIKENDDMIFLFVENSPLIGEYVLIDKNTGLIDFITQYSIDNHFFGQTVTQIVLWRNKASLHTSGINDYVFFDLLFSKFDIMTSDNHQTPDGRDFWIRKMYEAEQKGYFVGFVNTKLKSIKWYDKSIAFIKWVDDLKAWGYFSNFEDMIFVISKKKF